MIVFPGINTLDNNYLFERVGLLRNFADGIHIDVSDGVFTRSKTILPVEYEGLLPKEIEYEAHLMVIDPLNFFDDLKVAGMRRVIVHYDESSDKEYFLNLKNEAEKREMDFGLAFSESINLPEIEFLENFDQLLVMTVQLGESGQVFDAKQLKVIKYLREVLPEVEIEVDGGITLETAVESKSAGANKVVSTSYMEYLNLMEERYQALKSV